MNNIQELYDKWVQANINTKKYYKTWKQEKIEWPKRNSIKKINVGSAEDFYGSKVDKKFNKFSEIEQELFRELVERLGDNIYRLNNGQYLIVIKYEDNIWIEERNCINE